jgi:hypothetical protein
MDDPLWYGLENPRLRAMSVEQVVREAIAAIDVPP